MSRHQRKRARTADRERVVEALTTAYVEGQLDEAEREERVGRALTAERLEELRPLLTDLQLPQHLRLPEPVGAPRPVPALRARPSPTMRRPWESTPTWMKVLLGVLAVGMTAGIVRGIVTEHADPAPILTPAGIERLTDEVDDTFGTTEVVEADLSDDRALVTLVTDDGVHSETFSWNGEEFFLNYRGGLPEGQLVDLAEVDPAGLVGQLESVRSDLGVEDASTVSVNVGDPPAGPPRLRFEVANEFRETASMETDLSGEEVLSRSPRS